MKINISFLNVPMLDEVEFCKKTFNKSNLKLNDEENQILLNEINKFDKKLKDNMYITSYPIYENREIEWKQLHRMVSSDYRQYSHFEFNKRKKISENWRNDKQNILILDVDDGCSIDEAKKIFKEYKYFICTTKSHRQDKKGVICDRFRVILCSNNIPKGDIFFDFIKEMELKYPFIDKQPNCKTGAFLGHAKCDYWYNDGKEFDCSPLLELSQARKQLKATPQQKEIIEDINIDNLKLLFTRETVADIIRHLGYDVNNQFKFKYRMNERTPSATIRNEVNPLIKDFGSDLSTDIIGFVMEVKNVDFIESVKFIKNYMGV